MADVPHDPIGNAIGSLTSSSVDSVDSSTSGNKLEATVSSAPVQSGLVKLEETVGPELKPKRRDGKEARKRQKRQWNARKAARVQAEKEEQIERELQERLAMMRAQSCWDEAAAGRRMRSAEQIEDPWGFGEADRSQERNRVQMAPINTPQHSWRPYQPKRATTEERGFSHSGNASSAVSIHKSKLCNVPSDCRAAVLKENRSKFSVEEALDVRKFIMDSMLESACTVSFLDSGLIRQNTIYMLTCTDSGTALKLVNCCAQKATSRKWIVCLMNAIPIPTIIRGTVIGLILSEEKIIPFMKLVNGDLGLDFDSWKLVSFDKQGHKTTITIEVPEKDGEIVRKVGHLGLELTRVRFWILSKRRWQDDFEEEGTSNQHLLGKPRSSGLQHNLSHGPPASPILSADEL